MKEIINKLEKERTDLQTRIYKINNAINAMQKVCTHKYEDGRCAFDYIGNDSHKDHYKCSLCGKTDSY